MQSNSEKTHGNNYAVVLFGVNLTGSHLHPEIFQISSVFSNSYSFNSFIQPRKGISYEVSKSTSFTVANGNLFWHKRKVKTSGILLALEKFLVFLKIFGKPVILASYDAGHRDSIWLTKAMQDYGYLKKFSSIVQGFTEIIDIVKDKLPDRKSYKLEAVTHDVLNLEISLTLHNVSYDLKTVEKLIEKLKITDEEMINRSFSMATVKTEIAVINSARIDQISLAFLKSIIPINMIEKLAKAGVNYAKLRNAYKMNNKKGVQLLLSGWVDGQPKVTDDREIIEKINNMMKLLSNTKRNRIVSFNRGKV